MIQREEFSCPERDHLSFLKVHLDAALNYV
jgi:hypothetical protein